MRTCLVVDDSSVIRKVARRILEGLDFQIVEAEDGEKALEVCKRGLPEAILRASCRRQRIHHEAVRQGHRHGQVPGSRPYLTFDPAAERPSALSFQSCRLAGPGE